LRSWIHGVFDRQEFESEMDAELRLHIADYTEDLVRSGMPRAEAERRARVEFGPVASVKEECRQALGLRIVDELRQDLRYAARTLRNSPALTAVAVLSLALGIGANTSIFSLMDAVLLRFLPVREPQELYFLAHGTGEKLSTASNYRLLEHYRANTNVFSGIAGFATAEFKVRSGDGIELVMGQFASGNYYELLGVPLSLGRGFRYESEPAPDDNFTAVISDAYWSRRFGRDPGVIGKTLVVEGETVSIIGVTRPEFFGLYPGLRADITLPLAMKTVLDRPDWYTSFKYWATTPLVGRLRPGVSQAEALAAVDVSFRQFMDTPESRWAKENSPERFRAAALLPASKGLDDLRRKYSKPLYVLMGMVGIVLLIACANIANLLLARATTRSKEIAVRLSIGAGRPRIMRQLLTESLVLALLGGAMGILVGAWATKALIAMMATGRYPVQLNVPWDLRVFLFVLTVCLATALLSGLAPAIRATRVDLSPALKGNARSGSQNKRWDSSKALIMTQVSLCVLVLSGTGLLVRTLYNLNAQNTGFAKENILLVTVDTSPARLAPSRKNELLSELLSRIERFAGVLSASYSTLSPLGTSETVRRIEAPGLPVDSQQALAVNKGGGAWANVVSPAYFKTLGIPLLSGRIFQEQDGTTPKLAIVNQSMARFYFGDTDVLGRRFIFSSQPDEPVEIVGVVQDTMQKNLRADWPHIVYTPWAQERNAPRWFTAEIRTENDPHALINAVQAEARSLHKDFITQHVRTMSEEVDATLVQERLLATLSTAFGGLALLLACIGLYGVMAYSVVRRTREIGIRMALGAERAAVLWRVLRESLWLVLLGAFAGLTLAVWAAPFAGDLLYELSPTDPAVFLGSAALLIVVAALASYLPARRASRIEPVVALRDE
jgi:predicted permease